MRFLCPLSCPLPFPFSSLRELQAMEALQNGQSTVEGSIEGQSAGAASHAMIEKILSEEPRWQGMGAALPLGPEAYPPPVPRVVLRTGSPPSPDFSNPRSLLAGWCPAPSSHLTPFFTKYFWGEFTQMHYSQGLAGVHICIHGADLHTYVCSSLMAVPFWLCELCVSLGRDQLWSGHPQLACGLCRGGTADPC